MEVVVETGLTVGVVGLTAVEAEESVYLGKGEYYWNLGLIFFKDLRKKILIYKKFFQFIDGLLMGRIYDKRTRYSPEAPLDAPPLSESFFIFFV